MKNHLIIVIALAVVILMQSCSSTVYHFDPNAYFSQKKYTDEMPFLMQGCNGNAPMFAKRNDFNISGDLASGGGDLRLSYAPSEHFGLMATVSSIGSTNSNPGTISVPYTETDTNYVWNGFNGEQYTVTTTNGYKDIDYTKTQTQQQSNYEVAAGYYDPFGSAGRWELMLGGGFGNASNTYNYAVNSNQSYQASFIESRSYSHFFLQNDVGFFTKRFEGSIAARLAFYDFSNQSFKTDYTIPQYEMTSVNVTLEPTFHLGYGWKHFRLFCEYGFVLPVTSTEVNWIGTFRTGASFKF